MEWVFHYWGTCIPNDVIRNMVIPKLETSILGFVTNQNETIPQKYIWLSQKPFSCSFQEQVIPMVVPSMSLPSELEEVELKGK